MNVLSLLKKYDIHPKKSLGQNFLIALPTIEKIVRTLNISESDKILEIGPGPGIMTKLLTEQAKFVAAVETDKEMIRILENELGKTPNLHVIHGDVLDTNLEKLIGTKDRWLFAGNIPYNITSPLLFHLRHFRNLFRYGLLTMQKEVGDRLTAVPGTKDYGILSIGLQVISKVERCFKISPSSFYPAPKVDSTVVKISFEDATDYGVSDLDFFTNVVRAAFGTRRKKLKNSMSNSPFLKLPKKKIEEAIEALGIAQTSRAEELDIKTFVKLANALQI